MTTSHLTNPAQDAGQVIGYSHSAKLPKNGDQAAGYSISSGQACIDPLHRFCRGDDGNALVGFEGEQVIISRDDEVCLSRDGRCQHRIVIRVTAYALRQRWRFDHLHQLMQFIECAVARCIRAHEDGIELRAADYVSQFGQERRAADEREISVAHLFQQFMRRTSPQEPGQQYVCINDRPHVYAVPPARLLLPR